MIKFIHSILKLIGMIVGVIIIYLALAFIYGYAYEFYYTKIKGVQIEEGAGMIWGAKVVNSLILILLIDFIILYMNYGGYEVPPDGGWMSNLIVYPFIFYICFAVLCLGAAVLLED